MNSKNSTQNTSIIIDCISQVIGIEMPTALLSGGNPAVSGIGHLASCTIRSGGKYLVNEYLLTRTEHPHLFKMGSLVLGCVGGAVKYSLTGYYLASVPGVLPTLMAIGCINNLLYEFVSDLDERYATPILIETLEVIIKTTANAQFSDDELLKGHNTGFYVYILSQTTYPLVRDNLKLVVNDLFKESEGAFSLPCIQHPLVAGMTRAENASACIDILKIVDYCPANYDGM